MATVGEGAASRGLELVAVSESDSSMSVDVTAVVLGRETITTTVRSLDGAAKSREADRNAALKSMSMLPSEKADYAESLQKCSWMQASYLVLGETFGTGVLGLPKAMSSLGWVIGLLSVFLFGLAARYAGQLLYRVKARCFPDVMSYGEAGDATISYVFGRIMAVFVQLNWFLLMPYYLVAGATSLQAALSGVAPSLQVWQLTFIFAAPLLVLTQLKSLSSISYLSGASTLAIIVVCIIAVATILAEPVAAGVTVTTSIGLPAGSTFLSAYADVSSFIFAFQGQDMHYEIMREMKHLSHYPRAVSVANSVMALSYAGVSAAVYAKFGTNTPSFLLDAIPDGIWKTTASALTTFHVMVAYLLVSQPLVDKISRAVMTCCTKSSSKKPSSLTSSLWWFALTTGTLALALVIANGIPFFNDFQNLLGSLMGSTIVFGAPALFYLRAYKLTGIRKPWVDTFFAGLFLLLLYPFTLFVGTYMAVGDIVQDWQASTA
mmetsp:Transcript_6221/g.17397  ORF Transcript_6221/g.17397 Transcript_6221/m.17397 type:complete len:491 (+) Transcript_6221:185-1657(+)